MPKANVVRFSGLAVFGLVVVAIALIWWLFADRLVQRGVEATGESIVGARVELEGVDLRPSEGSIRMNGLQVANPQAPMTNLLEADEIVVDLMVEPLLERKVVVQNLVVTGVRFDTPRETSGALENPDPEAGRIWREVTDWADQIELPDLSLQSLTGVVRVDAISADSLRTVQYVRRVVTGADSLRGAWEARIAILDPRPRIDSLRAVAERLQQFRPSPLNALQIPDLVSDGRAALEDLTSLQTEVAALDDTVREGLASLQVGPETIDELRQADLAYARRLLDIPALDAPTLSPALFGGTALTWLKPMLYWVRTAERFVPPGLDPRNRPGPRRARADGTTVEFPGRAEYPAFVVQEGEIGVEIAGTGTAAGVYTALVRGLTTSPSVWGQPLAITIGRQEAAQRPMGLSLAAVLDHTSEVIRDSVGLAITGVGLPNIDLPVIGGGLELGEGDSAFELLRIGNEIAAELHWESSDLRWTRPAGDAAAPRPEIGTAAWVRDLMWSTLMGIERVELGMALRGSVSSPSVSVSSNLGDVLAQSLQRELGAQIADAEARLRSEIDGHIQPILDDARSRVADVRSGIGDRVASQRQEIDQLRAQIEARIHELSRGLI